MTGPLRTSIRWPGTIERSYDLQDRLTEEETPEGTVSYTYDSAGRRASMTVAAQTVVSYTYDAADQLTGVTQGTASVGLTYDDAGRRTSLTLPNGIVVARILSTIRSVDLVP